MRLMRREPSDRSERFNVMRIALLPLLATAAVFVAATCVTSFEGQWPTGPWTGEFQNNNDYDATLFQPSRLTVNRDHEGL